MRRPQPGRSAFTLLEMLVALALMGVLAGSLYASLHIGFRARRQADAALAPVRAAGVAMALVCKDLESALPPSGLLSGSLVGQDATDVTSRGDADTLVLHTAVGDDGDSACDVWKIELAVVPDDDDDSQLVLVRRVTTNLLAPETPEPDEQVLCRGVRGFNLRYFDGADWLDSWDCSTRGNILPLAVEVTIEVDGRDTGEEDADVYQSTRVLALRCARLPEPQGAPTAQPASR